MTREMCPKCNQVRNMRVSTSERTDTGKDGKAKLIRTLMFHCEVCYEFVRSEDKEVQAEGE